MSGATCLLDNTRGTTLANHVFQEGQRGPSLTGLKPHRENLARCTIFHSCDCKGTKRVAWLGNSSATTPVAAAGAEPGGEVLNWWDRALHSQQHFSFFLPRALLNSPRSGFPLGLCSSTSLHRGSVAGSFAQPESH